MRSIRKHTWVAASVAAVVAGALVVPAASASAGAGEQAGGVVTLRAGAGDFLPTSAEGGTLVLTSVRPRATFDHDPDDGGVTRLPTSHAVKLLGDEEQVPVLVRRIGAPKDEDAYAMVLSQIVYDEDDGLSATAELSDEADEQLDAEGVDPGAPPLDLGAVELVAVDSNAPVDDAGEPTAPKSTATSNDNTVFLTVNTNFPLGTSIDFQGTGGDCITNQDSFAWGQQQPPDHIDIKFDKVTSGGSCWIQPSVARWRVSIQPPGVSDYDKLWVYFEVDQLSPVSYTASCTTIAQPHRPTCTGSTTVVGNNVSVTMTPGA
jgi:hypothetical protein